MIILAKLFEHVHKGLSNKPVAFLKMIIILWSVMVIALALAIDNPWILAAIAAYEMLP